MRRLRGAVVAAVTIAAIWFWSIGIQARNGSKTKTGGSFRVLIDLNQLQPGEEGVAHTGDGAWCITVNSPANTNWRQALANQPWLVSEDNPTSTAQVGIVGGYAGRAVDEAFGYNEGPGLTDTVLTAQQIATYHALVGNKIVVLDRSYADIRRKYLDDALTNPAVAGACFEFDVEQPYLQLNFVQGIRNVLAAGRRCYLLVPPAPDTVAHQTYLAAIEQLAWWLRQNGLDRDGNVYIVLAVYGRAQTGVTFTAAYPGDPNAIATVAAWLTAWRDGSSGGN